MGSFETSHHRGVLTCSMSYVFFRVSSSCDMSHGLHVFLAGELRVKRSDGAGTQPLPTVQFASHAQYAFILAPVLASKVNELYSFDTSSLASTPANCVLYWPLRALTGIPPPAKFSIMYSPSLWRQAQHDQYQPCKWWNFQSEVILALSPTPPPSLRVWLASCPSGHAEARCPEFMNLHLLHRPSRRLDVFQ